MLVQSAIHFALDYVIQSACRYFEVSISSNKVWGIFVLHDPSAHFWIKMLYEKSKISNSLITLCKSNIAS